jgi:hypothetical protein
MHGFHKIVFTNKYIGIGTLFSVEEKPEREAYDLSSRVLLIMRGSVPPRHDTHSSRDAHVYNFEYDSLL